jgi:Ca2+ transporting ATPase
MWWCCAEKQRYDRIGESTEVALRVLVEKIGLLGLDMDSLNLSKQERASYCNSNWENENENVSVCPSSSKITPLDLCCTGLSY